MPKRIHIVINPASGQPEPILNTLNQVFQPAGVQWNVSVTNEAGDCAKQVRQAAESGVDLVGVYGGDGTVMEAVNGVLGSQVPLLVLPGGTGNILSIELGIPQTLEEAAALAVNEEALVQEIDAAQSDGRSFLLRTAIGFMAEGINQTTRELRDKYGRLAYLVAAAKALPALEQVDYTFVVDGEKIEFRGATCLIENAGNIGRPGTPLAPGISIHDGLLDLVAIRSMDVPTILSVLASIAGNEPASDRFSRWQGREIKVCSDPPQPVVLDGEPHGETPCTATVLPGAVRVLVPSALE